MQITLYDAKVKLDDANKKYQGNCIGVVHLYYGSKIKVHSL